MKKTNLFSLVALATMTLSGCSNDEVVNDYSPENAIQFGTYVGRDAASRASVISADDLAAQGFGVFAYYTDDADFSAAAKPNFMFNQKVTGIGVGTGSETQNTTDKTTSWNNGWEYTPLKYWPNEATDKVSFFAYAPHSTSANNYITLSENTAAGDPIISYVVDGTVLNHKDVLYAEPVLNKCKANGGVNVEDKVMFNFKHALSRIGFNVETVIDAVSDKNTGDDDDLNVNNSNGTTLDGSTHVYIDKVELIGSFYNNGKLNLNKGEWVESNYTVGQTTYTLENSNFEITNVTTTKQKLNADNSYIMIIPKNFTNTEDDATTQLQVKTTYRVVTTDSALEGGKSEVTNVITSDAFGLEFVQGKAYTFTLHLGLTSVKLTASVSDWENGGDIAVNVPINTGTNPTTGSN